MRIVRQGTFGRCEDRRQILAVIDVARRRPDPVEEVVDGYRSMGETMKITPGTLSLKGVRLMKGMR